ncbi:MAG: V-type ATPase subunit, partial [Nitrospiria bacterium]
ADEPFLPGGADVDRDLLRRVVRADDWGAVAAMVSRTPYGPVAVDLRSIHSPETQVERKIHTNLLRRIDALTLPDPVGFGIVIGYVERKISEIGNLRMIARGVEDGMDPPAIRAVLMLRNGTP